MNMETMLHLFGQQFINLLRDESVIAMHRVVIAESATNPHVSELFYEAGPKQAIRVLQRAMRQCANTALDEQTRLSLGVVLCEFAKV